MKRLLFVDDDEPFRERLAQAFRRRGYDVVTAPCAADGRSAVGNTDEPFDAAVIDLKMPGESGLGLVRWLFKHSPGMKILVLTGYGSIAGAVHALKLGAADYLTKPADADQIEKTLLGSATPSAPMAATVTPVAAPSLGRVEWEHIQRVLHECDGSISAAARALGIERRSLQRKLQKHPPRN